MAPPLKNTTKRAKGKSVLAKHQFSQAGQSTNGKGGKGSNISLDNAANARSARSKEFALERLALKERQMGMFGGRNKPKNAKQGIVLTQSSLPLDITSKVRERNMIDDLLESESNQIMDSRKSSDSVNSAPHANSNPFAILSEEHGSDMTQPKISFQLAPSLLESVVMSRQVQASNEDDYDDI